MYILAAMDRLEAAVLPCICAPEEQDTCRAEFQHNSISAHSLEEVIRRFYLRLEALLRRNYDQAKKRHGKPVEDAKRYIEQNYTRQISLEEVAAQVGLSSAYFSKLFKSELGVGYAEYLTEVRLEHAKRLLLDSNGSVKEIAAQVGYLDDKYFSKLFKKQTGIKPSEFRRLYIG